MKFLFLLFFVGNVFGAKSLEIAPHFGGTCNSSGEFCAYFTPQDYPVEAVRSYLKSAQKSIWIATYNMSIPDYAEILNQKAKDGVEIIYMVDYKLSFGNKLWPKLSKNKRIHKYRIPVFRGRSPQMHNKIILIDDEILLNGSANYSTFGLTANYENVMAIKERGTINKFKDEFAEMKQIATVTCELFGGGKCQKGGHDWDEEMNELLTTGMFKSDSLIGKSRCKFLSLGKKGLLNALNDEAVSDISSCFSNKKLGRKIEELVERIGGIEQYADGVLTRTDPDYRYRTDSQTGKYRSYFSPEDNVLGVILKNLNKTLNVPSQSFAYVSTNFINHPLLAKKLVELHNAGVHVRTFFDYGRFKSDGFQIALETLSALGFYGDPTLINARMDQLGLENPHVPGDMKNTVTIFHNTQTGDYACNHNKMFVVGTPNENILVNGSANWSWGAMNKNDENLVVIEDEAISAIYLREILSQLYAYRYEQNGRSAEYEREIELISQQNRCVKIALGKETSNPNCSESSWKPALYSATILSLEAAPIDPSKKRIYAYSPQLNNNRGGSVPLYTHKLFAGRWIGSLPFPPNWNFEYKYYALPLSQSPPQYKAPKGAIWERPGVGNDRAGSNADHAVHRLPGTSQWGVY